MPNRIHRLASATLLAAAAPFFRSPSPRKKSRSKSSRRPTNNFSSRACQGRPDLHLQGRWRAIRLDSESSRRPALRQRWQTLRQTFRWTFLGSERRQPRYRKAIANAPSPDADSIPWLLVNILSHDGIGRAFSRHNHPAPQHQRWQSAGLRLRRFARRPGSPRSILR